jgi:probable HAF family extracellular repeat protein
MDLGTLGGTSSYSGGVNRSGIVSGTSTLSGDAVRRAFIWKRGEMEDLGTFGGPNSSNDWPPNDFGEVAGNAESSELDPLAANICAFGTDHACRGYVWRNGAKRMLPTLGGVNSLAGSINNRRQVFGAAETTARGPCSPYVRQFLPVIWENYLVSRVLPLPEGDSDGSAYMANDRGQVIGFTVGCAGFRAVMWQDGVALNLGTLGGTSAFAASVNNRGQVVGQSDVASNATFRGFLWWGGAMRDLGTLPGDAASFAYSINDDGIVVGDSYDASFNARAFLWKRGRIHDLNALVPASTTLLLLSGRHVNAKGLITGYGRDKQTGEVHAYLALPVGK